MKRKRFDFDIDWEGVIFVVSWLVVFAIIIFSMSGCGTSREYKDSVRVDTAYVVKREVRVDSVWVDRYRNVYVQGDTVYDVRTEFKEKYVFLDRVDTLLHTVVDSVYVEIENPEAKLRGTVAGHGGRSGYDRFCSWGFWILLVVLVGYIAIRVIRWKLR